MAQIEKVIKKYIARHLVVDKTGVDVARSTGITVVIPAYLEKDYIFTCLNSLKSNYTVNTKIEVIIVVNASVNSPAEVIAEQNNLYTALEAYSEKNSNDRLRFIPLKEFNIRKKHFGVGYARKTGMDQAVIRYFSSRRYDGVIVSLDADCTVAPDYLREIELFFSYKKNTGCSIYFEHSLEVNDDLKLYKAITQYELHLRYYKNALKQTGFPYAFHTVGSSFAMRTGQYVRAGGMPRNQAGEDFYLIHKVVHAGGYSELNTTCVYPSARLSARVPFGTGPAVIKMMDGEAEYMTYDLEAFHDLMMLFEKRTLLYAIEEEDLNSLINDLPDRLAAFLTGDNFYDSIKNLSGNCSSAEIFSKRFFELFNAFKVVKYLNFVHNSILQKVPVTSAAARLLDEMGIKHDEKINSKELLNIYRKIEKRY